MDQHELLQTNQWLARSIHHRFVDLDLLDGPVAVSSRVTYDSAAAIARQSYFAFARLKGLPDRTVVWRHRRRNAVITVVAYLSLRVVYLVAGMVESLLAYPSICHVLGHAVIARDVPMVQGHRLAAWKPN
jgi:peptide/nickel transport system permease protein